MLLGPPPHREAHRVSLQWPRLDRIRIHRERVSVLMLRGVWKTESCAKFFADENRNSILMIVTTAQLLESRLRQISCCWRVQHQQSLRLFRGCIQRRRRPSLSSSQKARAPIPTSACLKPIIGTAEQIFPEAIFAVCYLHYGDEETCHDCIDSGFYSSVIIDASYEVFFGRKRRDRQGHQRRGGAGPAWRRRG